MFLEKVEIGYLKFEKKKKKSALLNLFKKVDLFLLELCAMRCRV